MCIEEGLHLGAQFGVAGALPFEERGALFGGPLQRALEDAVNLSPALAVHRAQPFCSSRRRNALARSHSRPTVAGETFKTSAVSSTLKPPK